MTFNGGICADAIGTKTSCVGQSKVVTQTTMNHLYINKPVCASARNLFRAPASLILHLNLCKTATLKNSKIGFQDQLSHIVGQKYYRSTLLSTFIKIPFVIKVFVATNFEWPYYTGFTVLVREPDYVV